MTARKVNGQAIAKSAAQWNRLTVNQILQVWLQAQMSCQGAGEQQYWIKPREISNLVSPEIDR